MVTQTLASRRTLPTRSESRTTSSPVITPGQLENDLIAKIRLQAAKEVKRKEEESGLKAKDLPARVNLDPEALLAASTTEIEIEEEHQAMDSDDDAEDQDFRPDGDAANVPEPEPVENIEEMDLVYSGESEAGEFEDEDDEETAESNATGNARLANKENIDPAADDDDAVVRRAGSRRAKFKAIVADSDDEMDGVAETIPEPPRSLSATTTSAGGDDLELDLDGGFSQFFEPTQAATLAEATQASANVGVKYDGLLTRFPLLERRVFSSPP